MKIADKNLRTLIINIIIFTIAFAIIIPFLWVMMISLKKPLELLQHPEYFFPESINLKNYALLLGPLYRFYIFYLNSIKVAFIAVSGCVITSSMAGYAFGRLRFPGRDTLFLLYLATMMIPPQVTIIPRYIMFYYAGFVNTHYSLILPALVNVVATFLMRQFFMQIPNEISESAYIDGAGEYNIFFRVIFPLAQPAVISVVILIFSWVWNDYQNPLIFLHKKALYTLPLGVTVFAEENNTQMELVAAAATLTTLPVLIVFFLAQKKFIQGLTAGALKG